MPEDPANRRDFRLHLFPVGHFPTPAAAPARQLPDIPEEFTAHVRLAVDAHPAARMITFDRLPGPAPGAGVEPGTDPEYEPLGGLTDVEWQRRFLVRAATGHSRAEYCWPPAQLHPEGGIEEAVPVVLPIGTRLDRHGDPEGRLLVEPDTPPATRSVPPELVNRRVLRVEVRRPLPAWRSVAAPWFAQPGGARRVHLTHPVTELTAQGYLAEVTPTQGKRFPTFT